VVGPEGFEPSSFAMSRRRLLGGGTIPPPHNH